MLFAMADDAVELKKRVKDKRIAGVGMESDKQAVIKENGWSLHAMSSYFGFHLACTPNLLQGFLVSI